MLLGSYKARWGYLGLICLQFVFLSLFSFDMHMIVYIHVYLIFAFFFYKEWNSDVDLDIAHVVKMYNHTGLVSHGFSFVIVPLC